MNESNRLVAGLVLCATVAWPAMAQERAQGLDQELAQERAQERSVCADGACAVSRVPRSALADALRGQPQPQALNRAARREAEPQAAVRDPWASRLAGPSANEDYSCLLSVGVGGEFARNGFFATRVLGQTIVLGGKEEKAPPR